MLKGASCFAVLTPQAAVPCSSSHHTSDAPGCLWLPAPAAASHLRTMKSETKSHNLQGTPITVGARHLTSENPMRTVLQCCTQFRTDTCDVQGLSDFFDCIGEFSPVFSHCFTAMPLSQPEEANSPGFIKRHCNYSFLVLI